MTVSYFPKFVLYYLFFQNVFRFWYFVESLTFCWNELSQKMWILSLLGQGTFQNSASFSLILPPLENWKWKLLHLRKMKVRKSSNQPDIFSGLHTLYV